MLNSSRRRAIRSLIVVVPLAAFSRVALPAAADDDPVAKLWACARKGDAAQVQELLATGVDVNAKTAYGVTALGFACARGHTEVVKILLDGGAEVNEKDSFYGTSPLSSAAMGDYDDIIRMLVERGAADVDDAFLTMVGKKNVPLVRLMLEKGNVSPETIQVAWSTVRDSKSKELIDLLREQDVDLAVEPQPLDESLVSRLSGVYESQRDARVEVCADDGQLQLKFESGPSRKLVYLGDNKFRLLTSTIDFDVQGEVATAFRMQYGSGQERFKRVDPDRKPEVTAVEVSPEQAEAMRREDLAASSRNWPQFRGTSARGVADGQCAPVRWDVDKNLNVKWKTAIPGLAHSSPVVWDDRIYLTTAVGKAGKNELRIGLYGDVDSVEDESVHRFQVMCLDRENGDLIWLRTAAEAVPAIKRHLKSSHANTTPATDGRHVVALFGAEGLYCYTSEGELLWEKRLGALDSGWFFDPDYQWGFGSSPIIYNHLVIVQCDVQKGSFVAALDVDTGSEVWKVSRDEIPTWSTPTVHETPGGPLLITNGTRSVRGYDADSGSLLWWLSGNSEIAVPTPFVARNLIFATSGYRPVQPIHAVRLNARGDITPDASGPFSPAAESGLVWTKQRGGPYLPTPIVYRAYLYTCSNNGVVACYHAETGARLNRQRLKGPGTKSFVASAVASDGHLYFTAETGDVYVLEASPELRQIATNPLGEYCLSTPAISDGMMFFRGQRHLIAIETQAETTPVVSDKHEPEAEETAPKS